MEDIIDICGKPIEIKYIKDYKIIDVEYIFRPVYREESVKKLLKTHKKYVYESMEPYAAIKSGKRQGGLLGFVKTEKDAHIRYEIINAAGRTMTVYFDEIPVVVYLEDGRKVEVFKDNKDYDIQGRERTPAIEIIEALKITAKEDYIFYGRDIHLFSVLNEYAKVKDAVKKYRSRNNKSGDEAPEHNTENIDGNVNNSSAKAGKNIGVFVNDKFRMLKNTAGNVAGKVKDKIKKESDEPADDVHPNDGKKRIGSIIDDLKKKYGPLE